MTPLYRWIRYLFLTSLRVFVLCWNRPKAILASGIVRAPKVLPLIKVTTHRENVSAVRKKIKRKRQSWGWAVEKREFTLQVRDKKIFAFSLDDTSHLNLHTFFLNRSPAPLQSAIEKFRRLGSPLKIYPGMRVFEPGCNAGRNLFFFKDFYRASIIGADVYEPAVHLARKADIFKNANFFVADLVESQFLDQFLENEFDLTIIRSHIVHIAHIESPKRQAYLERLIKISRQVLVIEKQNIIVDRFLEQFNFKVITSNGTRYGYLRSSN